MRIYISGKMTGIKEYNRPKFNEVASKLRDMGYDVFNPAEIKGEDSWEWADYMRKCIIGLMSCDAVFTLDDWEQSDGAKIEVELAKDLGIPVINSEITTENLDHTANLALRVVQLERAVKRLSDMLIKHDVDIHRLKNETEYLDETWRQTREIQLAMSDELEAIKNADKTRG